jgi:hypothetical protein
MADRKRFHSSLVPFRAAEPAAAAASDDGGEVTFTSWEIAVMSCADASGSCRKGRCQAPLAPPFVGYRSRHVDNRKGGIGELRLVCHHPATHRINVDSMAGMLTMRRHEKD